MAKVQNIKLTHKVLYEEFAEAVVALIAREKLGGRYLASEHELGRLFGVSRETVRRGMRLLETRGVVSRQQGRGTLALPKRKTATGAHPFRVVVAYSALGFNEGYASAMVAGFSDASARMHAALSFVNLMTPEARRKLPLDLNAGHFDALALLSITDRSYIEELLRVWQGPRVLMDHYFPDLPMDGVTDDGEGGARLAMAHLLELGHRRIGYIDIGRRALNPWRYKGYAGALADAGIPVDEKMVVPAFSSFEAGRMAAEHLLALPLPPTAILAFSDVHAWGALRAFEARGLAAGRDIALVGFADCTERRGMPDILTTVRFDAREIGRRGFERLCQQMQCKLRKHGEWTLVPTELTIRQSSGNGPG